MLNIISGRSGCGKTERLAAVMGSIAAEGEKCLMIVPDQSTFENERMFLRMLGPVLAGNVLVFGFSRLCEYIFENTGGRKLHCIDDGDRQLIMSLALEETKDCLNLFASEKRRGEYIKTLLQTITDYKKWGITPDMLKDTALKTSDLMLKEKLRETALIYHSYNAILEKGENREKNGEKDEGAEETGYMAQSRIDPFDMTEAALEALQGTELFCGMTVGVDSFRDFTARQTALLKEIMRRSREFYMTVTDHPGAADGSGLFDSTRASRRAFERIAKDMDIPLGKTQVMLENKRYKNDELLYLERGFLFGTGEIFEGKPENLIVSQCDSIYDEVNMTACRIEELIQKEGFRYGDIYVVFRHAQSYAPLLRGTFEKYGIPFFCDVPEDIRVKPLIRLVKGCMSAVVSSFEREEVLRIMKTGLVCVSDYETSIFENYLLMWSLSGKALLKPFEANPAGFGAELGEKERQQLAELEQIRKKIMLPLERFKESCEDTDCKGISKALYTLLQELHTEEQIEDMYQKLTALELASKGEEEIRLWEMMMGILDKMVLILGDTPLTLKRYSELMELQIEAAEIAFIPQGLDRVTIGQADRIRLSGAKAVFLVGAIEGQFPTVPVDEGIFSDREKKEMLNLGLPASDFFEEVLSKERFIAYYVLSSPSEKLFVSWYRTALAGDVNEPSVIVRELLRIFPELEMRGESMMSAEGEKLLWAEKPAFELCAMRYGERTQEPFAMGLTSYFEKSPRYRNKLKAIKRAVSREHSAIEDPKVARALFGKSFAMTASQAEKYHLCPFSYFCTYGLKAKERKTARMTPSEYGTIIHYILENYFKDFSPGKKPSREETVKAVQKLLQEYGERYLGKESRENHALMFLLEKLRDNAAALIMRISEELVQSEFVPKSFELNIGMDVPPYRIKTDEGDSISVYGVIDRVDVMEKNGETYVRIIDYKTGKKDFKLSDILFGLNMQMLIYMEALCKGTGEKTGREPVPAGILYMPSGSLFVDSDFSMDREKIKTEVDKKRKMSGLVLDNDTVIQGMEKDAAGIYLPVRLTKDGKYSGTESLVNAAEIKRIFDKINSILKKMVTELLKGNISQIPAKGSVDACAWCPYWQTCGYQEGMKTKEVSRIGKQAVMELLENEKSGQAGSGLSEVFDRENKAEKGEK